MLRRRFGSSVFVGQTSETVFESDQAPAESIGVIRNAADPRARETHCRFANRRRAAEGRVDSIFDGGPIETTDISPLELARKIAYAMEKGRRVLEGKGE